MTDWGPCPLSPGLLERYRLQAGHHRRPDQIGGHLMRRKGSSLEFHEFTPYVPGDDIRRVDWQASARTGNEDQMLVRRFTAEERSTLLVSLDSHPSMLLPQSLPKMQIACWLAEALAVTGLHFGDRVVLHRLFGATRGGVVDLPSGGSHQIRARLKTLLQDKDSNREAMRFNTYALERFLPPASIWVIITDGYFVHDDQARKLARTMSAAQMGLRWLIVVDLASWPMERALLGEGERLLEGPGVADPDRLYHITKEHLTGVAMDIRAHKHHFRKLVSRAACDFTTWTWPEDAATSPASFFRDQFLKDRTLQRIFMRES